MEFEPKLLHPNDETTPIFTHDDLLRILKTKSNSAPGRDNLQYDFYKNCSSITGYICQIINRILFTKVVPSSFTFTEKMFRRENKILLLYPKAKISLASFVQSYLYMLTISPRHFGE